MLNFISTKIQIAYAIMSVMIFTRMCDNTKKLHINYDVRGVASVSAIDKLELELDSEEIFYESKTSKHIRENAHMHQRFGLVKTGADFVNDVNLDSFKARLPNGTYLTREEYEASLAYRQDQFRVVFPNGNVLTSNKEYENYLADKQLQRKQELDTGAAMDETFALAI